MKSRPLDWIALTIVIIGAINWGLIGFFQFDMVALLFGGMDSLLSRFLYAIVGIAGFYCLTLYSRLGVDNDETIISE